MVPGVSAKALGYASTLAPLPSRAVFQPMKVKPLRVGITPGNSAVISDPGAPSIPAGAPLPPLASNMMYEVFSSLPGSGVGSGVGCSPFHLSLGVVPYT